MKLVELPVIGDVKADDVVPTAAPAAFWTPDANEVGELDIVPADIEAADSGYGIGASL